MTDVPGDPPGSNICGQMRIVGAERAEICTFQPHPDHVAHFWEDAQSYFERTLAWYDSKRDHLGQLGDELRRLQAKFIFKWGVELQRIMGVEQQDPPNVDMSDPPGIPRRTAPEKGNYPPLRPVRDGDAPRELGICGATKTEDGQMFICVAPPNHQHDHNWIDYDVAVSNADWNFSRLQQLARELEQQRQRIIRGEVPRDLPPFGSPIDHKPPPLVDPDADTIEIPPLDWPDMPPIDDEVDGDEMPDDPTPPPIPPGTHPGRPPGARGPGDPKWDESVNQGAKWSEEALRPPAQPDPLPGAEPDLPEDVSGQPAGTGGGRKEPNYCRATMRSKGKIYICWKEFGHLRIEEPHRWTYWKDEGE